MDLYNILIFIFAFFIEFLSNNVINGEKNAKGSHEYCIIGAGPAGIQLAYFLQNSKRDYVVFERSDSAGAFFKKFPRHRKLISINKRFTGEKNEEFNMRHDWNSLLSYRKNNSKPLKFTSYSDQLFPDASLLVDYLRDFVNLHKLNIIYNTDVSNIQCVHDAHDCTISTKHMYSQKYNSNKKQCSKFQLSDQNGNTFSCKVLFVATGLWSPNIPPSLKEVEGYEDISVNPKDYEGLSVLILGRGNSAFELAQSIYGSTNFVHMASRSRVRNAFATHYVGDIRAVNNEIFDTYQLKSLDGFLDIDFNEAEIFKLKEKYYIKPKYMPISINSSDPDYSKLSSNILTVGYDKVIRCLGFRFNNSIFNETMNFTAATGRISKYPVINNDYESTDYSNLFFIGTLSHSLDFRKSSGGFIHGFRYTVRALHRITEYRYHGVKWPSIELPFHALLNYMLRRLNEAAGPYQMFGQLVDIISLKKENKSFVYFEEFPLGLIQNFKDTTGHDLDEFIIINLQYGKNFSGPDKDVFREDRAVGDAMLAHLSNFLHPVLYYYKVFPKLDATKSNDTLEYADKMHHMVEDFTTFWLHPTQHQLHLRRFFESILDTDLRSYTKQDCLEFYMTRASYPVSCEKYFNK